MGVWPPNCCASGEVCLLGWRAKLGTRGIPTGQGIGDEIAPTLAGKSSSRGQSQNGSPGLPSRSTCCPDRSPGIPAQQTSATGDKVQLGAQVYPSGRGGSRGQSLNGSPSSEGLMGVLPLCYWHSSEVIRMVYVVPHNNPVNSVWLERY